MSKVLPHFVDKSDERFWCLRTYFKDSRKCGNENFIWKKYHIFGEWRDKEQVSGAGGTVLLASCAKLSNEYTFHYHRRNIPSLFRTHKKKEIWQIWCWLNLSKRRLLDSNTKNLQYWLFAHSFRWSFFDDKSSFFDWTCWKLQNEWNGKDVYRWRWEFWQ